MKKIEEFDLVVLTTNLPKEGLTVGDVGTVVDIHRNGEGFTVEFTTLDGHTVAVVTLEAVKIRPIMKGEMSHSRLLAA
jgi:Domain of unknown function (DUF4926)